jgi:diguanylate cyclase (GGDEF)-like protein
MRPACSSNSSLISTLERASPLPYAEGQGDYDPLELIELQKKLSDIAFDMAKPFSAVVHDLGLTMREFFGTRFVEFLMVEGDFLVYKYINNMPEALNRFVRQLIGSSGVIGMRIPLFPGSFFTQLIEKGAPREIMGHEELLHSFGDFIAPDSPRNIALRKHFAPMLMPLLGYDYIFQVPLMSDGRVIGYFSFLQRGRIRPRMRADLVLMSSQIAGFLSLRAQREQRQRLFDSLPSPTIRFGVEKREPESTLFDFRVTAVNPAFHALFRLDDQSIVGTWAEELGERVSFSDVVGIMREVSIMVREGGHGSLFFLDLNRFKQVNDSLGHDAGDLLLRHVAEILGAALRESDFIARLGGDEFVLFCRRADRNSAPLVAAKIASSLASSPLSLQGQEIVAETSIGIATFPETASSPEALLSAADGAMYRSKREGLPYCMACETAKAGELAAGTNRQP